LKKKLFDGKLKDPIGFVVGLSIISSTCIIIFIIFDCLIIFGENSNSDNIGMGIFAILALVFGIGFPLLFVHVVKNKERYPRLAKLMVKPGYFIDE
jgi:O-antigen/teichoic acid export membrane protein